MLTVFADQYLFKIREIIPEGVDLRFYNPEEGIPENLDEADAMLVRTVTDINEKTLPSVPKKLKFVGSGSAGTDHVDTEYLAANDVHFAYSAGCNARAVAEYVVTSLLIWCERNGIDLKEETIGIVGVGHVGSALKQMLDRFGWSYLLYDPPRAEREASFKSAELPDLLDCSVLTFHTPLHFNGQHTTYHWLNKKYLSDREFKLVINTARGGVIDEQALIDSATSGTVQDMIIDVWENEPVFNDEVAQKAFIATPHIAGYSIQAKFRATQMIVQEMIDYFSLELPVSRLNNNKNTISFSDNSTADASLAEILTDIHPIINYERELSKLVGLPEHQKGKKFSRLRTSMPFRNEYSFLEVPEMLYDRFPLLQKLGIDP